MQLNTYSIIPSKNTANFHKSYPNIFISKKNKSKKTFEPFLSKTSNLYSPILPNDNSFYSKSLKSRNYDKNINLSLPTSLIFSNEIPEREQYKIRNKSINNNINYYPYKDDKREKKNNLFSINKERNNESEMLKKSKRKIKKLV